MSRLARRAAALVAAAALCAATATHAQSADSSADARTLYKLEDQWPQALVRRDAATFSRLLDDRYVYTDEGGVRGKREVIAESTSGTDTVTAARNKGMRAHLFGTTGVVTGILVMEGRGSDGPFARRYRFTDTWTRHGDTWIMVASQDALLPK